MSVTGQTSWGVLYVLYCELKVMKGDISHTTPPDTYTAIPHSGGTPTMQYTPKMSSYTYIYSHNIQLLVEDNWENSEIVVS